MQTYNTNKQQHMKTALHPQPAQPISGSMYHMLDPPQANSKIKLSQRTSRAKMHRTGSSS
jgi:hypothetical protein